MRTIYTMIKSTSVLICLAMLASMSGCTDEDPPLPDNILEFQAEELGFEADENSLTITLSLSREATTEENLTIAVAPDGVAYDVDFTTTPAVTSGTLTLPVPVGATTVSFTITKKEGVVLDGDENISFTITSAESLVPGEKDVIVVSFSEIVAQQASMDPNVGGQLQPNKVFIDLSANRQTSLDRGDWDLGFYTADGQFRVILNSSTAMMARSLDKNDLNNVTAADTIGWGAQLSSDGVFAAINSDELPDWVLTSVSWIDDPSGDMTKTAIGEIASAAGENKVYIVNRGKNPDGSQRGWKKIRVARNGNNYTLQHADINATSFTTVEVTRDADFLFNYVNFEEGVTEIEPEKEKWDIAFTTFTNTTSLGPGLVIPYFFNDIVLQNRHGVETAELMISSAGTYEDFSEASLTGITFSTSQTAIGSKWRSGGGPSSAPAVREDRFYLVKDANGNIYKLRFTAMSQNGERGRPQIEFALINQQ